MLLNLTSFEFCSPTNAILDSSDAVRRYLESPTSCKCGLQCPLIVDKVCSINKKTNCDRIDYISKLEVSSSCYFISKLLENDIN